MSTTQQQIKELQEEIKEIKQLLKELTIKVGEIDYNTSPQRKIEQEDFIRSKMSSFTS